MTKIFLTMVFFFSLAGSASGDEIASFFRAKVLPLPSEEEILKVLSASKKGKTVSFSRNRVAYKYSLLKIMQIIPEKYQNPKESSACEGKDLTVYVFYDQVEADKRVSLLQRCSGECVAVLEKVGRPGDRKFRSTTAISPSVSIDSSICDGIESSSSVLNVIDKTGNSIVE